MKYLMNLLVLLFSLSVFNSSFAGIYDDWRDEAICTWLEQKPDNEEFLAENEKRELNCFKREDFSPRKDPIKEEYKSNEGSSY